MPKGLFASGAHDVDRSIHPSSHKFGFGDPIQGRAARCHTDAIFEIDFVERATDRRCRYGVSEDFHRDGR